MPRVTLIGSFVIHTPVEARAAILVELIEQQGNVVHAADALGVQHRTLRRWIVKLGLDVDLDLIRARAGVNAGSIKGAQKLRGPRKK